MTYFTWKESGLTEDCETLESMASRFEESAELIRRMSKEGFKLLSKENKKIITHSDKNIFDEWGFISEEPLYKQLTLIPEE